MNRVSTMVWFVLAICEEDAMNRVSTMVRFVLPICGENAMV